MTSCQTNSSSEDTTSYPQESDEEERKRIEEQWRKDREHLEKLHKLEGVE